MSDTENPSPASSAPRRRPAMLLLTALVFGTIGIAWGAWWALEARHHVDTDDAYVAGDVVQITPQIAGTVLAIHADDTDQVQPGTVLVELDPADAQVALDQAEAALARTVRDVRTLFATGASLDATVAQRESDLARARDDLRRREALTGTGAVSGEELQHARSTVNAAEAALANAREQRASNHALIDNTTVEQHPSVAQAAAKVEEAWLALQRTRLPAPIAGQVVKRSVQVGTRVSPGQPLMAVVPLDSLWVEANFKESQLGGMHPGQRAVLTADLYGSKVEYHGRVVGLAAGTGSAFALLPAQNATGNWIKVVQRVPVRIALDPEELKAHPLRIGLSMVVDVDRRDPGDGQPLASAGVTARRSSEAMPALPDGARQRVKAIVAANLGAAVSRGSPVAGTPVAGTPVAGSPAAGAPAGHAPLAALR